MEKNSTSNRLQALDGLRGLAILLVILNHVDASPLYSSFPFISSLGIFSSGVTGVSFLFILSGFLMAYLYPQPRMVQFLQKRYSRIFPLFLTMCAFMFVLRIIPEMAWYVQIGSLFLLAGVAHVLWVYVIKKINKPALSKTLFFSFIGLQLFVAVLYALWIGKHPPAFFASFPYPIHEGIVFLVNATLTFPLGNYIPMLDGVYWSLASEVLFYILYPILLIPLINHLSGKSRYIKISFLFALLPFLGAIHMLSQHILVLSAFQFVLFYYFATGITLGYLYRQRAPQFTKLSQWGSGWFARSSILLLFAGIFFINLIGSYVSRDIAPWIRLLFAIPFTLLITISLDNQTILSRFLRSKIWVYLGTISFSLYLSHAAVIHMAEKIFGKTNSISFIFFLLTIIICDVAIASALYLLLEKPYFDRSNVTKKNLKVVAIKQISPRKVVSILGILLFIFSSGIFFAFQSHYNLLSFEVPISKEHIRSIPHTSNLVTLRGKEYLTLELSAIENNVGLVTGVISHIAPKKRVKDPQLLTVKISDKKTGSVISQTDYVLDFFKNEEFPFGFPIQTDSKGKTYVVDLFYTWEPSDEFIQADTTSFKAVYQLSKSQVLSNPTQGVSLIIHKLQQVFSDTQARLIMLFALPFFVVSFVSLISPKRLKPRK